MRSLLEIVRKDVFHNVAGEIAFLAHCNLMRLSCVGCLTSFSTRPFQSNKYTVTVTSLLRFINLLPVPFNAPANPFQLHSDLASSSLLFGHPGHGMPT